MREAFEAALVKEPDVPLVSIVEEVKGNIDQAESAHMRYVSKITEDSQKWINACDGWYAIGANLHSGDSLFDQEGTREEIRAHLPLILEWEEEGATHLLGRLESGFRRVFPIAGTGLSFGELIEARETGVPVLDLRSEAFLDDFKDLIGLSGSEAEEFDRFLLEQRSSGEHSLPYCEIRQVLPMVARWVQHRFNPDSP